MYAKQNGSALISYIYTTKCVINISQIKYQDGHRLNHPAGLNTGFYQRFILSASSMVKMAE